MASAAHSPKDSSAPAPRWSSRAARPTRCAETEAHLTAMGGEALGVPTHMGDLDALQALVDTTVERFGGIDIVVNNAANALDAAARGVHRSRRGTSRTTSTCAVRCSSSSTRCRT